MTLKVYLTRVMWTCECKCTPKVCGLTLLTGIEKKIGSSPTKSAFTCNRDEISSWDKLVRDEKISVYT